MAKNSKYTICVDRLDIIVTATYPFWNGLSAGNIPKSVAIGGNITLLPLEKTNPFYDFCFKLKLENEIIANIYCGHSFRLRYKSTNPVKIEMLNNILYQDSWTNKLTSIFIELKLKFYKYDYAEIAIDGYNLICEQKSLMDSQQYHRKQPLSNIAESSDETKGNIKGILLGSRLSDKNISIYNKQHTLEKDNKLYIKDFWELNGLEILPQKQIDRAEIRLKRKQANLLSPDFVNLNKPDYLSSVFKSYGGHYLEYINNSDKRKRKFIIDWKAFRNITNVKPKSTKVPISNLALKPVIKKLYFEFCNTGAIHFSDSYNTLAKTYNLLSWLNSKTSKWDNELKYQ